MKHALIFVVASVFLSACGVKKTAAPPLGDLSFSAYASCYNGSNQRNDAPRSGVVDSGYFGKLIDRTDLSQLLVCDIPSTASHAKQESLSLYVVNQGVQSCNDFSFLPSPSPHVYSYWADASGEVGSNSLLGLYKEDCGDDCKANQVINPLVLLNACTDRWTMVHEMTHHNFNVQRKKFKPFDSDEAIVASLENELSVMQEIIDGYNSAPSEYQGMQLVHSLDRVRDLMIRFVYQTSFEEISIESILMRELAKGNFLNVPSKSVRNAINYIRYSASAGIERLAPIKSAVDNLKDSARESGWSRVVSNAAILKSKIETFEDDTTCYVEEADSLYRQATVAGIFPGGTEWSFFHSMTSVAGIEAHVEARAKILAEVDKRLQNILNRIKK